MKRNQTKRPSLRIRNRRGSAELVAGIIFLLPIFLFIVDAGSMVVAANINDELAKKAARAAATQSKATQTQAAIAFVKTRFNAGGLIKINKLELKRFDTTGSEGVQVRSEITLSLPAPVPLIANGSSILLTAEAHEPIVGLEASLH